MMVIIGSVLGAAAPSLRGFFISRRTQDTAARIAALTRLARSCAVSEARVYRLVFAGGRTIFVAASSGGTFERLQTSLGRPLQVPPEVGVELAVAGAAPGRDYIDFFPDGRTEPATVRVTDIKGGVAQVTCRGPAELFALEEREDLR